MNLPNLKDARVRTKSETIIKRDDYQVPDSMKEIGKDKYYCIYTYIIYFL